MRKFMPHQVKAFNYAKPLARIALFMEMRLGKTMVTIRWAEHNKLCPNLVIAPLSVLPSWEEELLEEGYAYEDICWLWGKKPEEVEHLFHNSGATWFLINYEALLEPNPNYNPDSKRSRKMIGGSTLKHNWASLILDESTRIRNPQAETTRHLVDDCFRIGYRAILSGLPAPESPLDYYEQFNFLHGNFMHCPNYWIFRRKWFMECGYDYVPSRFAKDQIKKEVQTRAFVLTRKQAGIGSKKIFSKRYVEMNPTQKRLYKEIEKGFEYEYEGERKETKWIPVKYLWYGMIAGGFTPEGKLVSDAKLQELINLFRGELKNEPTVIWFRYNQEIEYISRALQEKGFTVGVFTGSNKTGSDKFKSGKVQILCAQARCGQYGIDWSRSSTAIYYSNYYDGEVRYQSEDRIVHPKKREPVLYIDLVTKGSIDESVIKILREKKINSKQFAMKLVQSWSEYVRQKLNNRPRTKRNGMGTVESEVGTGRKRSIKVKPKRLESKGSRNR